MRIPNDIDQIIWEIAESNRPEDVLDFERRYPSYRLELHKRIKMVAALRQGKPDQPAEAPARFTPKPSISPTRGLHPALIAFAAVLAVVAIGGVTQSILSKSPEVQARVEVPRQPYTETPAPDQNATSPQGVNPQMSPPINPQGNLQGNQETANGVGPANLDAAGKPVDDGLLNAPDSGERIPEFHRKKSLKLAKAPLMAALKLIADSGGLRCEFAPGFPNPDVVVDFREMSPVEMLQQLGRDYAFSTFEEGERNVLFVPAVDPAERSKPAPKPTDGDVTRPGEVDGEPAGDPSISIGPSTPDRPVPEKPSGKNPQKVKPGKGNTRITPLPAPMR